MLRRIHVSRVLPGDIAIDEREAHHVRDVLRLPEHTQVELFDDAGNVGTGTLKYAQAGQVIARVESVHAAPAAALRLVIATAVPKAHRADWMVEKLSELGVDRFIPLAAERSVVLPEGKNKLERWRRLAEEAAKQSRRRGVMRIDPLIPLASVVGAASDAGHRWHLSTASGASPIRNLLNTMDPQGELWLFIGPEGGWSLAEVELFASSGIPGVSLTHTVLRVETAAIAAAAVVLAGTPGSPIS